MSLKIGDTAPDFEVLTTQGPIKFHDWIGDSWAVLFSHPKDFTPVCTSELQLIQSDIAKFKAANADVVGFSTDTVFSHKAFQKSLGGLTFSLATDRWPYGEVAKTYGVYPPTRHQLPFWNDRAIFIVDKSGKLAWSKVYEIGQVPDIDEVLAELAKLN